jgi:pimeloyl-ACP methyl ester carboxylesterase
MIWRPPKYTGPERRKAPRCRPRPLRALLFLLAVVVIGHTVGVLTLVNGETTLVLEAGQTLGDARPPFPYMQIDLPRNDDRRQFAWVMPREQPGGPWVLYLHGNASTLASTVNISHYRELRHAGLNVMAPEYRGFAGLDGVPTESALEADARTAYDYLRFIRKIPPGQIVVYGWSLGSAVAVDLAAAIDEGAVILEGAAASASAMSARRYPLFPMRLLMRNGFDPVGNVGRIRAPMLFIHGIDDEVVPRSEGRRLFEAVQSDKRFLELRGGHVTVIDANASAFSDTVRQFVGEHGLLPEQQAVKGEIRSEGRSPSKIAVSPVASRTAAGVHARR